MWGKEMEDQISNIKNQTTEISFAIFLTSHHTGYITKKKKIFKGVFITHFISVICETE